MFSKLIDLHFNEIDVLGSGNVPAEGPLLICCNHSNQFVDGCVLLSKLKRDIHFIGAAKSVRRPVIGHLLRLAKTIPVERAQDLQKVGKGQVVRIEGNNVFGEGTAFT